MQDHHPAFGLSRAPAPTAGSDVFTIILPHRAEPDRAVILRSRRRRRITNRAFFCGRMMIVLRTTRFPGGNQRKNNNIRSARDASTTDAVILAPSNRNIRFGLKRTSSEVNEPCRWRSGRAIRSLRGRPESPFFLEQGFSDLSFWLVVTNCISFASPPRRGRCPHRPAGGIITNLS